MFSHIMLGANDLAASKQFYDAVLATVDAGPGFQDDKGRVFWFTPTGNFSISTPIDGAPATPANGGTIGFAMDTPERADAFHAAGLANGGTSIEDAPGWRESAMGKMYLAYLRDPSGNKLCMLHRPA